MTDIERWEEKKQCNLMASIMAVSNVLDKKTIEKYCMSDGSHALIDAVGRFNLYFKDGILNNGDYSNVKYTPRCISDVSNVKRGDAPTYDDNHLIVYPDYINEARRLYSDVFTTMASAVIDALHGRDWLGLYTRLEEFEYNIKHYLGMAVSNDDYLEKRHGDV